MKTIGVTGELVGLPTEEDRAWAEHELGLRLPRSYVDFTEAFGRGVLDELVHVFVPTRAVKDNLVAMAPALDSTVRADVAMGMAEYPPDGSPDVARRLVRFGSSWNGHILAWDVGDSMQDEYAVFVVAEASLAFTKVGYGLDRLLESIFSADVRRVLGPGYSPRERIFRPLPIA